MRRVICLVMTETVAAVEAVEEMPSIPGADGIFVGPSDLALSAGLGADPGCSDSTHRHRVEPVAAECDAAGITPGIFAGTVGEVRLGREFGYRMLATQSNANLLGLAAQRLLAESHEH